METKVNINTDKFSRSLLNDDHGMEMLYNTKSIDNVEFVNSDDLVLYNKMCDQLDLQPLGVLDDMDIDIPAYHQQQQDKWFIPEEYKTLDIEEYISQRLPKDV